jgi:serine/threonine protein kinase
VDDKTLQSRAKNKKIQIHDSVARPTNSTIFDGQTELNEGMTESFQQELGSPTVSLVRDKVGPDDFMPLKMLGSGSFGEVYLVREIATGELFAMKVLSKSKILGQNLVRYAKTERDVLSYTVHHFIVSLNFAF